MEVAGTFVAFSGLLVTVGVPLILSGSLQFDNTDQWIGDGLCLVNAFTGAAYLLVVQK
jgi:drug/metabolite transporter (DMT)-like permease